MTSNNFNDQFKEEVLYHYGIKGMKWKIHKASPLNPANAAVATATNIALKKNKIAKAGKTTLSQIKNWFTKPAKGATMAGKGASMASATRAKASSASNPGAAAQAVRSAAKNQTIANSINAKTQASSKRPERLANAQNNWQNAKAGTPARLANAQNNWKNAGAQAASSKAPNKQANTSSITKNLDKTKTYAADYEDAYTRKKKNGTKEIRSWAKDYPVSAGFRRTRFNATVAKSAKK